MAVLALLALAAAGLTLGVRAFGGDDVAVVTTPSSTVPPQPVPPRSAPAETVPLEDLTPKTTPEKPAPRVPPAEVRGVHVTMALTSLDGKLDEYLALAEYGLNTLEIDIKDENGEVGFVEPYVALAQTVGAASPYYDPREVAESVKEAGVYLIGRVVVFEDPVLSAERPGMAIQRPDGSVWRNSAGLGWTNPYDERVWEYNVDIAEVAVRAGFDEIMFDYVRYPTDGDVSNAVYPNRVKEPRHKTIARFLEYASSRLKPLGARVSAAVFGLAATRDLGIGQRPRRMAKAVDAIYPMVYPSHYRPGELDLQDPNAVPGRTVARTLREFRRVLRGRDAALIPWLQDFSLGRTYTLTDVQAQVDAARSADAGGFMLWNAAGIYTPQALEGS